MKRGELQGKWREESGEVMKEVEHWREQHPKATFREIEAEIDQQLAGLRAKMLSDTAMASAAGDWEETGAGEVCPQCRVKLEGKGKKKRKLETRGRQEVELVREYGVCPKCGQGIFPPG
jgi:DNA repair exonuclease SbcCD ATPase subunit